MNTWIHDTWTHICAMRTTTNAGKKNSDGFFKFGPFPTRYKDGVYKIHGRPPPVGKWDVSCHTFLTQLMVRLVSIRICFFALCSVGHILKIFSNASSYPWVFQVEPFSHTQFPRWCLDFDFKPDRKGTTFNFQGISVSVFKTRGM